MVMRGEISAERQLGSRDLEGSLRIKNSRNFASNDYAFSNT